MTGNEILRLASLAQNDRTLVLRTVTNIQQVFPLVILSAAKDLTPSVILIIPSVILSAAKDLTPLVILSAAKDLTPLSS